MSSDISAAWPGDLPGQDLMAQALPADVPVQLDTLPDGRPTLVLGNVGDFAQFNHLQGDNPYGFGEDCGLVSCQEVLNQFGHDVSEEDVVKHAIVNGECHVDPESAAKSGGTTPDLLARLLTDYGVPAHEETGRSLEDLAASVEHRHGAIVGLNAGVLWNDANAYDQGQANHAVTVIDVARDPATGQIQGFYINDSGNGQSGQFVSDRMMTRAWENTGGQCVITDVTYPARPGTGGQGS